MHHLEQCLNLEVAQQLVCKFYAVCSSFDRMRECSKIHTGMELRGITMHETVTLRGGSWGSGLHVLSFDWEHPKVGRYVFKPTKK